MTESTLTEANRIKEEISELKQEIRELHHAQSIVMNGHCLQTSEPDLFLKVKEISLDYYGKRIIKLEKKFASL